MRFSSVRLAVRILSATLAAVFALASVALAQTSQQAQQNQSQTQASINQINSMQQQLELMTDAQKRFRVTINPREQSAYDRFFHASPEDIDKKIQMGRDFLVKFPTSVLTEPVESGLVSAYYAKQDWNNLYAFADKALAINPDDVDVLTTVGWVIPRLYNPSNPDADKQLAQAESYAKHAIAVLEKMPKPQDLTDAQFAESKAHKSSQDHSALGLVYFRRDDYENSAKEFQQATQTTPTPDQADFYVLGIDLLHLNRFSEAADAFDRCSLIPGGLEDRCKQSAAEAKKQVK